MAIQNERDDKRILDALKDESPLSIEDVAKKTGLGIDITKASIERLKRQNYVEEVYSTFILTEFAEDVIFGGG